MRPLPLRWILLSICALVGCNMISGADGIIIDEDFDDDDDAAQGGNGAGNGPGATGGSGGTGGVVTPDWKPVDGITVDAVAINQGVKRGLMAGGAPVGTGVPVVEGRQSLVRAWYTTYPEYNGLPVTARLQVGAHPAFDVVQNLSGVSSDGALDSTINFIVPGEAIVGGAGFRIDVLQPPEQASGANASATYPATPGEHAPLPIQSSGPQLKIVLVPIRYDADGSGRLPDTSGGQVQLYSDLFFAIYPAARVEVTVGGVVGWDYAVEPMGGGWSELLNGVLTHRQNMNAPDDEYYYGLFNPEWSLNAYCSGGCVMGLSPLPGPGEADLRAGIGVGFGGNIVVETAVHEAGHLHGLPHAPCSSFGSIENVDPNYPHAGAIIGEWGYDLLAGILRPPNQFVDMMSYCEPIWISDYNYQLLFNRIRHVNGAARVVQPDGAAPTHYERISVSEDGTVSWHPPLRARGPLGGDKTSVTVAVGGQSLAIDGWWYPYSHLPGGLLLFPQANPAATHATWRIDGKLRTASRSQLTSRALTHKSR